MKQESNLFTQRSWYQLSGKWGEKIFRGNNCFSGCTRSRKILMSL